MMRDIRPLETTSIAYLDERYELGAEIGAGSFATVHVARDLVRDVDVAVKILRAEHMRSPELVAAFGREASLASRMMSPHVVKTLGLAVTREGAPCIVYELLHGETLAARIEREGALSLSETIEVVRQTGRALTRAHTLGVVHRDVKPDNVFFAKQEDGREIVKLLDFGIAEQTLPDGTVRQHLVGTPEYIAPEVLFGTQRPDARIDLYALGVLAFECLTGTCPYPGQNIDDVLLLAARGQRVSLAEARPDLPESIDAWLDRAIHPEPFWRFTTAKGMLEELDAAVATAQAARVLRRAA